MAQFFLLVILFLVVIFIGYYIEMSTSEVDASVFFAEPENAFQGKVNFLAFYINFFIFESFNRFFVKNQ